MDRKISLKTWGLFYGMITILVLTIIFLINQYGSFSLNLSPTLTNQIIKANPILQVLSGLILIILVARVLNIFLQKIHQPRVISEMLAGILIGPSFFGYFCPDTYSNIFSTNTITYFGIFAQFSIIIYMFIIGVKFDFHRVKDNKKYVIALGTAQSSIILPFCLGILSALWLYNHPAWINISDNSNINFLVFALFMGVSMSITAFPVLARIVTDQQMHNTTLGSFAMTCASVDDVVAWCLLALVLGMSNAAINGALITIVLTVAFIMLMLLIVKPIAHKVSHNLTKHLYSAEQQIALWFVALLCSAIAAEYIGIHAIFGAFLFGVIAPRDNKVINDLADKLHDVICVIFLPAFFAYIGIKTQINLLNDFDSWMLCLVIIAIATIGKFGGTYLGGRLFGLDKKLALSLGVLMNTRGLVELIALNIGLEAGIISPRLFTILVVMALVTTFMTGPVLHYLKKNQIAN